MEECEALCNRIAFLRAGILQGLGTTQVELNDFCETRTFAEQKKFA
jgi:hypothetical protein